jgi:hypothetical protein
MDRTVIVDWRDSDFLRDKSVNFFTEFYEAVPEIQGVPVLYAPSVGDDAPPDAVHDAQPHEWAQLAEHGSDVPFIVLTPFHGYERMERGGDELARFRRLRDFYSYVKPRDFVQREIDAFVELHKLDETFVVAVNIATGNGDYAKGGAFAGRVKTVWDDERRFLQKLVRARAQALQTLPPYLRDSAPTFVATDAADTRDILLRLPNAITRRTVYPPPGVGRRFSDYTDGVTDRDALVDILADHHLLAHCNAIIRNASVYATYALVTTMFYDGNIRNLESLFAQYRIEAARRRLRSLAERAARRARA